MPRLGLVRTGLVFGLLNALVALGARTCSAARIRRPRGLCVKAAVVLALLVAGLVAADELTSLAEEGMYADEVIFTQAARPTSASSITRGRAGFQLFLNGNLQFSSADEYRYHEALVHPALALAPGRRAACSCSAAATAWRCARS